MDRILIYAGQIPLETDLLRTNKNTMIAAARIVAAMLGTTATMLSGFAVTPTSPASMQVSVASGDIYSLQNIDGTAYSDIAADTSHAILKQGIALDPTLLTLTAPSGSGQSIAYLIQVGYQDVDTDNVALPYYNAANPTQAFSGPSGTGASQPTTRKGSAVIQAKAGIAATTGSQTTPSPDSGFVGAAVVTVANGQTTITSSSITAFASAPLLAGLLNSHHGGVPGQAPPINLASEVTGTLPLGNLPQSVQQAAAGGGTSQTNLGVNVAGGSDTTLTTSQAAYGILTLTGALTANKNLILPNNGRWLINNQTTGAYTLTAKTASGTGYIVRQGFTYDLYADGTNVQPSGIQGFYATSSVTLQANEVEYVYS